VRLDFALYAVIAVICILGLATLFGHKADLGLLAALIGLATALVTALVTYLRGKAGNDKEGG
jgi:type IV secretory pathway VirB2 component (pilin)